MKNKLFIAFILLALAAILTGVAAADELYSFELTEAEKIEEHDHNWYLNISVPQISGMADEEVQADLNAHFLAVKDEMLEEYKLNTEAAQQSIAEGNEPHFGYQYGYDIVTDTDQFFVFRTSWYFAAGSSTTLNEYFNLDKQTGELLSFDKHIVTSPEAMASIHDQIYEEMKAINESGEGMFWLEDDSLDVALGQTGNLNHWYFNENGELVITFDKYEVAPGAMGSPEFVVTVK